MIRLNEYPQLQLLAWNRPHDEFIDETEALALYERNWENVDKNGMSLKETALLKYLVEHYGNGCFAHI